MGYKTSKYSKKNSSNTELFSGRNMPNLTTQSHNSTLGFDIELKSIL